MTIYVDVIWLENVVMNLSIILSEGIILNLRGNFFRKLIASFVGAFFSALELFWHEITYFQIFISGLIILISFKPKKVKLFFKEILVFYFISFLFGGISFALMNINNDGIISIENGVLVGNFSLIFIFISALIGVLILYFILVEKKRHVFKNIIIGIGNMKFEVKVFLDTGNLLCEPYTNKPVIIVERDALKELFCEKIISSFDEIISGKVDMPLGMFLIPYRSLGNSNGFLLGIKPDYVILEDSKRKYTNLVIGICNEKISNNKEYSGIFGLKTLDEGVCSL